MKPELMQRDARVSLRWIKPPISDLPGNDTAPRQRTSELRENGLGSGALLSSG